VTVHVDTIPNPSPTNYVNMQAKSHTHNDKIHTNYMINSKSLIKFVRKKNHLIKKSKIIILYQTLPSTKQKKY